MFINIVLVFLLNQLNGKIINGRHLWKEPDIHVTAIEKWEARYGKSSSRNSVTDRENFRLPQEF